MIEEMLVQSRLIKRMKKSITNSVQATRSLKILILIKHKLLSKSDFSQGLKNYKMTIIIISMSFNVLGFFPI